VTGGPPPLARLKWEALSGLELVRLIGQGPSLLRAPRGDRPVAVLPGFAADDASTLPLRAFLRRLGHEVEGWRLGRNRGHLDALVPRVAERVLERAARRGEGIHLIGQSLGGVIAREVARDRPAAVVQVITLGTPIVGGPTSTRVGAAYSRADLRALDARIRERNRVPIEVPITAVYSRRDGIVSWEACLDRSSPRVSHVEVTSSHLGMGLDPHVWRLVAELLTRPGGG
jgi:pimeloyl-ACP methyl ester carboxylesterase